MSIRLKIFIAFFLLFIIGIFQLTRVFKDSVRKCYLESLEENMVDTANILAVFVAREFDQDKQLDSTKLQSLFAEIDRRRPSAKIYDLLKDRVDAEIYITDTSGRVLFDSKNPGKVGRDYSKWNDVSKTLQGKYGARSTRTDRNNPESSIIHVAAPIVLPKGSGGVLTLYKPIKYTSFFIRQRKNQMLDYALLTALAALIIFLVFAEWIAWPVLKLTDYVKALSRGERPPAPSIHGGEVKRLAEAFEELREKLDGRKYIEQYVQGVTHELKSPISAVRGAVEILEEADVSEQDKNHFIGNIKRENERMGTLIERLLHLSKLENRKPESTMKKINLTEIVETLLEDYQKSYPERGFSCSHPLKDTDVVGDEFLIREALDNLLKNAVDFTGRDGHITVKIDHNAAFAEIAVIDDGQGIPDFAGKRVFEKFYSLPRPETGQKSSGLGLSIVREIAILHGGTAEIINNEGKGVQASFTIKNKL